MKSNQRRFGHRNGIALKRNLNKVFENMSNQKRKAGKARTGLGISYSFKVFNKSKLEGSSEVFMRSVLDTVYGRVSPRKYVERNSINCSFSSHFIHSKNVALGNDSHLF